MKRILSMVLAICICLTMLPVVALPAAAASTSLTDMRSRAEAIVNYTWIPSQDIATWNGNAYNGRTYFAKGEVVKGVPYTLFTSEVVSWSLCSLSQYKLVASSNYSTTEYCVSVGATRTGPVYGSCCADLVCEVFGGSFMNGVSPRYHNVPAVQNSSYATTEFNVKASDIVAGDALSDVGRNHIIWVGEVTDDYFVIYEQTPPVARKTTISKSSINASGYLIYGGLVYSTVTKSKEASIAHTCDKGTYVYYEAAHPHYKCYKCSICGKVWRNTQEPTFVDSCSDCVPTRTIDDRYSSFFPIAAFPLSTGRISVYDKAGNLYSNRYIDGATDVCLIWEVYTDGWCKVRYPSSAESSGYFDAYVPFSTFTTSTYPSWWTAPKDYTTYRRSDLASTMHSISSGEDCFLLTTSGSVKQIIHFVSGEDYSMMGWINDPKTEVKPYINAWISETAMGESASEYKVGNRYYLCYELKDAVSGRLLDDVKAYSYTVKLSILLPDGSVGHTCSYTNDDNWISLFIEEPGTYTYKVEITGAFSYSDSVTRTMQENPKKIYASATAVDLAIGGTESKVIYAWTSGYHKGKTVLSWSTSNSNIGCAWGEWNEDNELPLTITAKSPGSSTITLTVKDKETNAVLDTCIVNVTVSASKYTISYNANGGSGAPASQTKNHGTALKLSTTIPTRFGYNFLGWSTSSAATSPSYYSGGTYSANANTTLYAVWGQPNEMSGNYAGFSWAAAINNGDAGVYYKFIPYTSTYYRIYGIDDRDTIVYLYDANGNLLKMDDDSGEGNQFQLDYYFDAGSVYYIYVRYYSSSQTGSLDFKISYGYRIKYDANGGSGAPSTTYKYDDFNAMLSETVPSKSNSVFLGWATSRSATTAEYQPGGIFSENRNITLYAVWESNKEESKNYVKWYSGTTSLNGTIDLNIYVLLSDDLVNADDTFVRFTYAGKTVDVPMADALHTPKGGYDNCYRFSTPIYAKQLADNVNVKFMKGSSIIGEELNYSVMTYCQNRIKKSTDPAEIAMCKALLNYGAVSQTYFGYNTGNLANISLSDADKVLKDVNASAYKHSITGTETGIKAKSATLMYVDVVKVRVYFTLTGSKTIDQYTFTIDGKEVAVQQNEKGYYVETDGIAAKDLEKMFKIQAGGITVNYGALSYVNSKVIGSSTSENEKNLAKALYAYWQAAEAYLG